MTIKKIFHVSREKLEILVSAFTAVSVGLIIYLLVYNPTKPIENIIYLFDLKSLTKENEQLIIFLIILG